MANRHLARTVALQSLYAWDFSGNFSNDSPKTAHRDDQLKATVDNAIEEFGPGLKDDIFVWQLIKGVTEKQPALDRVIENAAPEWSIDQITIVDRNILRLGLWELLFGNKEEVPPKVAINEAIELAKSFGARASGRFVNGVLGTVYRELHQESDAQLKAQSDEI
jgi:N utilization substance protein B